MARGVSKRDLWVAVFVVLLLIITLLASVIYYLGFIFGNFVSGTGHVVLDQSNVQDVSAGANGVDVNAVDNEDGGNGGTNGLSGVVLPFCFSDFSFNK